jgi:hypothetical protein
MATDKKIICPMMGGDVCVEDGAIRNGELVACRFWVTVMGKNPQTGETVNNGDCAIAWTPVLLIENSKVNRETASSVESLRNENVTIGQQISNALINATNASIANQTRNERVIGDIQ